MIKGTFSRSPKLNGTSLVVLFVCVCHILFRLLFGFMVTTAFLSMWISNTATAAMMLPIAHAVLQEIKSKEKLQQSYQDQEQTPLRDHDPDESLEDITEMNNNGEPSSTTVEMMPQADSEDSTTSDNDTGENTPHPNMVTTSQDDSYNTFEEDITQRRRRRKRVRFQLPSQLYSEEKLRDNKNLQKLSKGLMLGVAYGANIGGTATLTGTGPNLVLKGDIEKYVLELCLNFLDLNLAYIV